MERALNWIDGEFAPAASGATVDVVEPATGRVYGSAPDSGAEDVARAVDAAEGAFAGWSGTPAAERSRVLLRVASILERDLETFARAESRDAGKPIALARRVDIPRAVWNFRFFATAILHEQTEAHLTDREAINYTLRSPAGVAGLISPWNLPLYLLTWKVAPALASGCTAVAKPSELTPMTAFLLGRACEEAGLPRGVLNIVHGRGAAAGAALVEEPRVRAVSFTGGTATGRAIARSAAPAFKKLSLELGGKNANVVFADADLDEAASTAVRAAFTNAGQICLCGSRVLVERSAYAGFVERLVAGARAMRVGDPSEETTEIGALISREHQHKVLTYCNLARMEGGEVLTGGGPLAAPVNERCRGGFFLQPTVIAGLSPSCRTQQEEIFGPVVTVTPFDDEEEAVRLANGTPYGLAAMVWTRDLERGHRVASRMEAGVIWVNCWMVRDLRTPFGGMKQSGVGREGGWEALRFFTEARNVCIRVRT